VDAAALVRDSSAARVPAMLAVALAAVTFWLSSQAIRIPAQAPERLVAELRLAQVAALVLVFTAGAWIGFAVVARMPARGGLDAALSLGFFVVAGVASMRHPREALTLLAAGFAAHALVDIVHRPGGLPDDLAPRWYVIGCATFNLLLGAACYLPMLRRRA
jgi:hypothetical protein